MITFRMNIARFTGSISETRKSGRAIPHVLVAMLLLCCSYSVSAKQHLEQYVLSGYDVVSYFHEDGPKLGKKAHSMKYKGKYYAFKSAGNAKKFSLNPERYVPAYDGNCAYGLAHGVKSTVDPLVWEIVNDRLFLMINRGTERQWLRKSAKYISRSDRVWQKLSAR